MNVVVNALVLRVNGVRGVTGLHQIAVAERFGRELLGFYERSNRVGVVADYQYRYAPAIERSLKGWGGKLIVEEAN